MTVLHVLNTGTYSGAENVAISIISGIQKNNSENRVIYVALNGDIENKLKEQNIEYFLVDKICKKSISEVIKKFNPNIIHAHDFTASIICSFSTKNIPIISHLHNNPKWIKKINIRSLIYLVATRNINKILTVSEAIEKEYIFRRFITKKIICVGNPIRRESILKNVNSNDCLKKYDIVCVARLTSQKNPSKFINLINRLKADNKNIKAIWVGDGPLKDECLLLCKQLNLSNNIDFVGFKNNPYNYMNNSKVFVLTSDWEGFGLVAFEAITLGLPAVVSNVGGLPSIVKNSCGKLCDNLSDFEIEINRLLNDEKYYSRKSKMALEQSKKIENYNEYITKISQLYDLLFVR